MDAQTTCAKLPQTEIKKMQLFVQYVRGHADELNRSRQYDAEKFKEYIEKLADIKDPFALWAKGFCAYEGILGYKQDFAVSKDCFLQFLEKNEDVQVLNALGYIYYYGRANNGTPEYDKAFDCFSLAAAVGHPEATYKLSDLYLQGKGVWRQSTIAAEGLILRLYWDAMQELRKGNVHCKLPDLALRLGNIYLRYYDDGQNAAGLYRAHTYYRLAEYALSLRMKDGGNFGDASVKRKLEATLADIETRLPEKPQYAKEFLFEDPEPLYNIFDYAHKTAEVKITHPKSGGVKVTIKLKEPAFADSTKADIVEIHEIGVLSLTNKYTFWLEGNCSINCATDSFIADAIDYDGFTRFYRYGKEVAAISAEGYRFRRKDYTDYVPKDNAITYPIAGVQAENSDEIFDYICDFYDIKLNDWVLVPDENDVPIKAKIVALFNCKIPRDVRNDVKSVISKIQII